MRGVRGFLECVTYTNLSIDKKCLKISADPLVGFQAANGGCVIWSPGDLGYRCYLGCHGYSCYSGYLVVPLGSCGLMGLSVCSFVGPRTSQLTLNWEVVSAPIPLPAKLP